MTRQTRRGFFYQFLTVATLLSAGSLPAWADLFEFDNQQPSTPCVDTCGTVSVTFSGGTIHFEIDVGPDNVAFGNNKTFGFNVAGSTSGVVIDDFSDTLYSSDGNSTLNFDGLGVYEFSINGPTANKGESSFSFDVERPTDPFTDVSDVYVASSGTNSPPGGGYFVVQVHNVASGMPGISGFAQTGLTPVPEPASVFFFGVVLTGTCHLVRKRRRKH